MKQKIAKKCTSVLTACMLLAAVAQPMMPLSVTAASNLISNSTFDAGTKDWGMYKESGGVGSLSVEDGKLALKVSSVGKLTYSLQMYYDIIPLYQNGVYHFHYEISSSVPRVAEGMIQLNGGDYHSYTWKKLNLTNEPLVMDYEFTMEDETDIMAKMVFNCGNEGEELPEHTIYLDNVVLELVDDSKVDYSSSSNAGSSILANQIGYRTNSKKTAVVRDAQGATEFSVVNADTKQTVYTGTLSASIDNSSANEKNQIADFSSVTEDGTYYITCGNLDASYPFVISENPYTKLIDDSVRMLYLQRCGCEVEDKDFGHPACHTSMATIYHTNEKIDVSGGWHDAGDYGRYVVPAAKAVADLMYAYAANPELYSDNIGIPESGNGIPDVLDETRYELEWMLKMQASNGGVYHKVSCESFPGMTIMPQAEKGELIVTPISSTATADFCASMAMAAEFYADFDDAFAAKCLTAAEKAYEYLEQNPNFNFSNPSDISTGDYGDKSDKDERYWAVCQMYRTTKDEKYLNKLNEMSTATGMDWALVGDYGNIALLTLDGIDKNSTAYANAKKKVISAADTFKSRTKDSPYGSPIIKYNWGSNMTIANAGVILGLAYTLTGDEGYLDAANDTLSYLLGCNPLGTSFVTGYGTVAPEHPHHRPSISVGKAMTGMLVGGVNSSLEDSAAKAYCKDAPAAKCYIDNDGSYSTNEITIYWNSPLTYLLTLTEPKEIAPPPTGLIPGDVNGDFKLTVADALELQRYLLTEITELTAWENGDMDKDGKLTAIDMTLLKRKLMGQE